MTKNHSVRWNINIRKVPACVQTKIDRAKGDDFLIVADTKYDAGVKNATWSTEK